MLQYRRVLRAGLRAKFHDRLNFIFLAIRADDRHKNDYAIKNNFSLEIYCNNYLNCIRLVTNCRAGG